MKDLTILEHEVLQMLLRGDDDCLAILRSQAQQASVSLREMTGIGFFTHLVVPSEVPRVPGQPKFQLGDVNGTAENVKDGLGFVLFITDGALSMLEGYTYDEPWPDEFRGLVLGFSTGQARDLDQVRKSIAG